MTWLGVVAFEDGGRGPWAKEWKQPLRIGKGRVTYPPLESQEKL